ncbi:OmpA family protein [Pseudomonas akapageensis]|uniref:OmpA family protein n=1 Tax=Pseudomonas akapageensis TaxID=2609961 RepID=UPI00140E734A|nr:OmpA family protein [Pseudomonas akapageensis]
MRRAISLSLLASTIALTSCSSTQLDTLGREHGTAVLCGVGLLGGALLGAAVNGRNGALAGAALGTAAGCYAGSAWQSRMQALDRIAKEEGLKLTSTPLQIANSAPGAKPAEAGLVTEVESESMFDTGSDQLTAAGVRAVSKLAAEYSKNDGTPANAQRRFLVVGHTDATGTAQINQSLSEHRARTVGRLLRDAGIPASAIYYQGAGAARPIADNTDPLQRGRNRRVEIVETTSEDVLIKRIVSEQNNARYLAYGTVSERKPATVASATQAKAKPTNPVKASNTKPTTDSKGTSALVDFGGSPTTSDQLGYSLKPMTDGLSLISTARAAEPPMRTCQADKPRDSGAALNLATEQPLNQHATREYLPGYNNRVWANTVNGNLVTISPVSILREGAAVGTQPFIQIVTGYETAKKKNLGKLDAVANTYEGQDEVLYRVFVTEDNAAVSCMDIVFSKGNAKASQGALYYPDNGQSYTARFVPIRS